MEKCRIGLAQVHSLLGNVRDNLDKHLAHIERARSLGIDILAFPELSLAGYLLRD
ncbi:MAG: hypothetical protein DRJ43_06555 [Thermoprotei archaeon]|nr:MAG: hypothetical protein DRJ43_06555 [Thermoprotei archaeon]